MKYERAAESWSSKAIKAIGHPVRSWMLHELIKGDHRVTEFVDAVGVEFATISRHLARLRHAGLVSCKKKGREIWYRANTANIERLVNEIRGQR